jgi:hypothetical protein
MKGERKMNTRLWLILAGAAATGVLVLSKTLRSDNLKKPHLPKSLEIKGIHISFGKKQDKDKGKNEQDTGKDISKEIKKLNDAKDEIRALIDVFWEKECSYLQAEQRYRLYKKAFCDEGGILNYIQRLDGLCHYDMQNYEDADKLKTKIVDQLINGLYKSISLRMRRLGKSFILPDSFEIAMTKKAFINNENLDVVDCEDERGLKAVKDKIIKRIAQLENEMDTLNNEYNNVFYKELWLNSHKEIENLLDYYMNTDFRESKDIEKLRMDISEKVEDLKNALGDKIVFKYYEAANISKEDKRDLFVVIEKGDNCPAVLRNENELINKGKITRTKIEQL